MGEWLNEEALLEARKEASSRCPVTTAADAHGVHQYRGQGHEQISETMPFCRWCGSPMPLPYDGVLVPVSQIEEHEVGQLLAVATLYVNAFADADAMSLTEKMRLQEIEKILDRYGRRW